MKHQASKRISKMKDPITIIIRIHIGNIFQCYITKYQGWFRFFGRGIKWKHQTLPYPFSERIGKKKYRKIGHYIIGCLSPTNPH